MVLVFNPQQTRNTTMDVNNRTRLAALCCALAVLTLAGCGGSDTSASATEDLPTLQSDAAADGADGSTSSNDAADGSKGDEEVDPELAMAEFDKCMADHGISTGMAEGEGGGFTQSFETQVQDGAGPSEGDIDAALEECNELVGGIFQDIDDLSPEQQAEMADMNLEFEKCLQEKGIDIDMEDGGAFMLPDDIDMEDFEAAASECQPDPIRGEGG